MANFKKQKTKRYDGKKANVAQNLYFEEYMKSVAKGIIIYLKSFFKIIWLI